MDLGSPQQITPPPARRRRRWHRRHPWLLLILILAVCLFVVEVGLTPWDLHIGGRFTPTLSWDGYGAVQASNGGRYILFTHLQGGPVSNGGRGIVCDNLGGCETLQGSARLCGRDGSTDTFQLRGAVHSWWRTDGARTNVDLTGGTPRPLGDGWVVAFSGRWQGPVLVLADHDNSPRSSPPAGRSAQSPRPPTPERRLSRCGTAPARHSPGRAGPWPASFPPS